ncbi:MAG TPA: GIY-YIG nuclease family protein [Puia sp.]|nr:GIY-YIG nuclease family protein [Puia sp.]
MYSVYILYSESLMNYYVGSTENLEKRIKEHNSAKGNYTSKGVPWKLMIKIEKETRSEAVSLEMKIKKRGIKRYLQDNSLIDFSGRSAAR